MNFSSQKTFWFVACQKVFFLKKVSTKCRTYPDRPSDKVCCHEKWFFHYYFLNVGTYIIIKFILYVMFAKRKKDKVFDWFVFKLSSKIFRIIKERLLKIYIFKIILHFQQILNIVILNIYMQ